MPEPIQGWRDRKRIWSWYSDGVPYNSHHLPKAVFDRLLGGFANRGYRSYWTKAEALADLEAASVVHEDVDLV